MLKRLKELKSLYLFAPMCCGLERFALASLHPNLKSFSLQSTTYPNTVFRGDLPTRDFLKRHRQIEYLKLVYLTDEDGRVEKLEIGNDDLPNLRAVAILGEDSGFPLPNRPIEAMDIDTFPTLDQLPKLPRSTLKFMSVGRYRIRDENPQVAEILSEFPTLAELTLHCGDVYTKGGILTLEEKHLASVSITRNRDMTDKSFIDPVFPNPGRDPQLRQLSHCAHLQQPVGRKEKRVEPGTTCRYPVSTAQSQVSALGSQREDEVVRTEAFRREDYRNRNRAVKNADGSYAFCRQLYHRPLWGEGARLVAI